MRLEFIGKEKPNVVGRDYRQSEALGEIQRPLIGPLFSKPAGSGDLEVKRVATKVRPEPRPIRGAPVRAIGRSNGYFTVQTA
jgi:hypothetical protein